MKFQVIPSASGNYMTANGSTASIFPAQSGRDYADEAAFAAAMKLVPRDLYIARETKLNSLQSAFEKQCSAGATANGITLDLTTDSRATLDEFASHESRRLQVAADDAARAAIRAEMFALTDVHGVAHPMSIGDCLAVIVAAGEIYKEWWAALAQKRAAVAAATTVGEVEAIH